MRRKLTILLFITSLVAVPTLVTTTRGGAATSTIDLSLTGATVAGFTGSVSGSGQEMPFIFTMKNNSTTTNATDISFFFKWGTNVVSPSGSDYVCPLTSNHVLIAPDTPACEPGGLAAGKTTSAALLVTPKSSAVGSKITVQACALLLDGHTDPVSSNNCKTITIPVS